MNSPIHASAFAYKGAGCLILGESGVGKSALVANALIHGATLIADDQIILHSEGGVVYAEGVSELKGVLELRHFGLIRYCQTMRAHPIHLVLDLDATTPIDRLPEPAFYEIAGVKVPYVKHQPAPAPAMASLLLYLTAVHEGRVLPTDWHPTCAS